MHNTFESGIDPIVFTKISDTEKAIAEIAKDSYGGYYYAGSQDRLIVLSTTQDVLSSLSSVVDEKVVQYERAQYTLAQLEEANDMIGTLDGERFPISRWSVDVMNNRVVLGVTQLSEEVQQVILAELSKLGLKDTAMINMEQQQYGVPISEGYGVETDSNLEGMEKEDEGIDAAATKVVPGGLIGRFTSGGTYVAHSSVSFGARYNGDDFYVSSGHGTMKKGYVVKFAVPADGETYNPGSLEKRIKNAGKVIGKIYGFKYEGELDFSSITRTKGGNMRPKSYGGVTPVYISGVPAVNRRVIFTGAADKYVICQVLDNKYSFITSGNVKHTNMICVNKLGTVGTSGGPLMYEVQPGKFSITGTASTRFTDTNTTAFARVDKLLAVYNLSPVNMTVWG